ncbi:low temperature requirement protein A [Kutzneria sp. NPDC052558]|uniref:low temperature requirement protein A n=1 Tax=Kutzneria sp. NPDC052558 TaxID=3364121 RepID=UPI0037CB69C9
MTSAEEKAGGKRVGWVELYFDLVFVFAVGQVAHGIVTDPHWSRAGAALGLFVTLWWTWIGFAVLYNRRGDDKRVPDRLFLLAGTIPCAIAATQAHHVFEGHPAVFALALAGVRLILAVAHRWPSKGEATQNRIGWGYLVSTLLFVASAFLQSPWLYVVWGFALAQEAASLLLSDRGRRHGEPPSRATRWRELLTPPRHPDQALDPAHLSERFGLFMILLLGELVITIGAAVLERPSDDGGYWLVLVGGLLLAGALWWIYFTSAAEIYERLLGLSGGNPTLAYSLYAGGHLPPAFALLLIAAGVNLSLQEPAPSTAAWFVTAGLAIYLVGTKVFAAGPRHWYLGVAQIAMVAATVCLAFVDRILPAPGVVVVVAVWAVGVAAVTGRIRHKALDLLGDTPADFLRRLS